MHTLLSNSLPWLFILHIFVLPNATEIVSSVVHEFINVILGDLWLVPTWVVKP